MGVQADYRAAAITLLTSCASGLSVKMQIYPGRPRSLAPPTGFIDSMTEEFAPTFGSSDIFQHTPRIQILMVWGDFDSKEAVDQRDAFVDAYHDELRVSAHQAGPRSLIYPVNLSDLPTWVPDWLPIEQQRTYFATQFVLEGFATD